MELVGISKDNAYYVRNSIYDNVKQIDEKTFCTLKDVKDIRKEVEVKLEQFKNLAGVTALKLLFVNNNKVVKEDLFKQLYQVAYDLGLVVHQNQISVDAVNSGIFFSNLFRIVTFDVDKIQTNTNEVMTLCDLDVLDKNVIQLSRFGIDALEHIYLMINGNKIYMRNLIDFMEKMLETNFSQVLYIGITPSNKMFKFTVKNKYGDTDCCSVAFSDEETFFKKRSKLLSSNSLFGYNLYVNSVGFGQLFYCTKFSYKSYSYALGTTGEAVSRNLKQKYKTLRDVYISQ